MMLKDLGLAADAAASVGAPLHTGKAAVDLFTAMVDSGCVFGEAVVAAAGVAVSVHGLITRGRCAGWVARTSRAHTSS